MTLRPFLLSVPILLAAAVGTGAQAVPVIVNGNFETTSFTSSTQMNTTNVTGWSTSGYNFVFFPGTATTTGAASVQYGALILQGTLPSGASNGFPATSPRGGNFVGADGDFTVGAITQTVTGLTVGLQYAVSFYWGAAQQKGSGYTSATTEQWQVSLGSELHSTPIINNPPQGFTAWLSQTLTYTATSTSEVLSFLAAGTPSGAPPFSLLDGVSITAVAEPASWMTLVVAVLSIIGVANLRRRASRLARPATANGEAPPAGRAGHTKPRRRRRRSYAHSAAC
jgi:hypothetical protein